MRTKNIFKAVALAMLMPAMLLNTACSSEDDALNNTANTENTINKGYALPVTVNVTREGDAGTRATYNESTRKLEFSAGDQLWFRGVNDGGAGVFTALLTWQSGGKFSGNLYTQNEYKGTVDALLTVATDLQAYLLPAGYSTYGFLSFYKDLVESHNAILAFNDWKAFALTKAEAVEQFTLEGATSYSGGFALSPTNPILSFTITGLAASTVVAVNYESPYAEIDQNVTTDASGKATFALAAAGCINIEQFTLTVGGNAITLGSHALEAGKIYNITRSALTYPIALSAVTSSYVGSVVTTDGNVYATVAAASAAEKTAVAVIAYVGTAGSVDASSASYKGLAIALSDANGGSDCQWAEAGDGFANCLNGIGGQTDAIATALGFKNGITCTSTLTAAGHSSHNHTAATAAANNGTTAPTAASGWFMPSVGQWNLIVQGLASKKAGSAITTDLAESKENNTYKANNLNSVITDAGGTELKADSYWASTEENSVRAWTMDFWNGYATNFAKSINCYVRSVIAF